MHDAECSQSKSNITVKLQGYFWSCFNQPKLHYCGLWAFTTKVFYVCGQEACIGFLCLLLQSGSLKDQPRSIVFPPSPPKPQFASWLIEQVETGQYTGLRYVGQNKFRVPWKHNSRKDCNDEDSKIFRVGFNCQLNLLLWY